MVARPWGFESPLSHHPSFLPVYPEACQAVYARPDHMLIPDTLLKHVRRLLGLRSMDAPSTIPFLSERVRKERIEDLKSLMGSVELEVDIPKSRRRPSETR